MPLPTLECLDAAGHQVPGLVDVAEELVVVGLWGREEPCLHLPSGPPPQAPCSLPSGTGGLWGRPGRLSLHAHC